MFKTKGSRLLTCPNKWGSWYVRDNGVEADDLLKIEGLRLLVYRDSGAENMLPRRGETK